MAQIIEIEKIRWRTPPVRWYRCFSCMEARPEWRVAIADGEAVYRVVLCMDCVQYRTAGEVLAALEGGGVPQEGFNRIRRVR